MGAAPPASPPCIQGWTLLRPIGQGSYGEVWLARDEGGAYRALKIVRRARFDHERPYVRELSGIRKFEPISRLHPSQVAVFAVGEHPDYFYYVMELADDVTGAKPIDLATYQPKTLKSEAARPGRMRHEQCLEIGLALATAIEHLHRNGLVHRDIKPSNVIFVDGVPKLADIGLVTGVDATVSYVGTEGFLPPEGPGTPQADLYSLGKVLYEISTGQDRLEFPELPTLPSADPAATRQLLELNQVLLKACQNNPARRYQNTAQLIADLKLLRAGVSLRQNRSRAARRRRVQLAVLALAVLLGATSLATRWIERTGQQRQQQDIALERRIQQKASAMAASQTRSLSDIYAANGLTLATSGDVLGALVYLQLAWTNAPGDRASPSVRQREFRDLLARSPPIDFLVVAGDADGDGDGNGAASSFSDVQVSANGLSLAALDRRGQVRFFHGNSGRAASHPASAPAPVRHVLLDPEGDRAVVADATGALHLVTDIHTRPVTQAIVEPGRSSLPTLSSSGRQVALARDGTNAMVYETSSRRERFRFPQEHAVTALSFSPDGQRLAVASASSVRIWNVSSGEPTGPAIALESQGASLRFSPNGHRLLMLTAAGARLADTHSGMLAPQAPGQGAGDAFVDACFTADGRQIVTAGPDAQVRVWDAVSSRILATLPHSEPVRRVVVSPDGRLLFTLTGASLQIWETAAWNRRPTTLVCDTRSVPVFTPASHQILVLGPDGAIRAFGLAGPIAPSVLDAATADAGAAMRWAQSLAGRRLDDGGQLRPLTAIETIAISRDLPLPPRSPSAAPDLATWHETAARESESSRQWFSAVFHWEHLARIRPGDPGTGERLSDARRALDHAHETSLRPATKDSPFPVRDSATPAALLDLTAHFNARLDQSWLPGAPSNDLSGLPAGIHRFNKISFDVRGVIQLSSRAAENQGARFPISVAALPVGGTARHLHFLHGCAWSSLFGATIGRYIVRYEDDSEQELRLIFGRDLREWWSAPTQSPVTTGAALAWQGSNPAAAALGHQLRLYQIAWTNPHPAKRLVSVRFESAMDSAAPFLLAITVEP